VKLNKCVVIKSKSINRNKVFISRGDMQDIVKGKVAGRCGNNGGTDMSNVHIWPVGCVDLVGAGGRCMHSQVVQVTGNMISGTRIGVPHVVGAGRGGRGGGALFRYIVFIKAVPTFVGGVPNLEAHLALGPRVTGLH
jgi:hypothetical protein